MCQPHDLDVNLYLRVCVCVLLWWFRNALHSGTNCKFCTTNYKRLLYFMGRRNSCPHSSGHIIRPVSTGGGRCEAAEEPLSQQGVRRGRRRRSNRTPSHTAAPGRSERSGARRQQHRAAERRARSKRGTTAEERRRWGGGSGPPCRTFTAFNPLLSAPLTVGK